MELVGNTQAVVETIALGTRGSNFFFMALVDLEELLVTSLQDWFQYSALTSEFRWTHDLKSKIFILKEFSDDARNFPQVVPTATGASEHSLSLGNKVGFVEYDDDEVYLRFSGSFDVDVSLRVFASQPLQAKKIMDLLLLSLVYPLRRRLELRNVVFYPSSIMVTGFTQESVAEGLNYHLGTASFRVQIPWTQDFKLESYDLEEILIEPSGGEE